MVKCFTFHRGSVHDNFDISDLSAYLAANRRADVVSTALDTCAHNLVVLVTAPPPAVVPKK